MGDVITIDRFPSRDAIAGLRKIADMMENGQFDCESVTVCNGVDVWHMEKSTDEQSVVKAVWNMQYGITKMMTHAVDCVKD